MRLLEWWRRRRAEARAQAAVRRALEAELVDRRARRLKEEELRAQARVPPRTFRWPEARPPAAEPERRLAREREAEDRERRRQADQAGRNDDTPSFQLPNVASWESPPTAPPDPPASSIDPGGGSSGGGGASGDW